MTVCRNEPGVTSHVVAESLRPSMNLSHNKVCDDLTSRIGHWFMRPDWVRSMRVFPSIRFPHSRL